MPRYIDADALREKMFHEAFEKDTQDQKWDCGCWIRYHMFENAVDSIPTADVVERKKGKWETEIRTIRGHKIPFFACSVCGKNTDDEYTYCPTCGAEMVEGGEDVKS